ncbi:MAG: VWA domain-containing protein [Bacteroidales bacterium]|jgi:Ca-activated chloride channel family protein|nr:VWA domain-containing protein [Bacteroidales bacterium]
MEGLMQFGQEYMLWVLLAIPAIIVLYILALRRRKRDLAVYGEEELTAVLMPEASVSAYRWKIVLTVLGFSLLIIGAAGPRIGSKLKEVEQKGREVIIALDVSNSMLAEDVKPSRIERAKQMISRMVDEMDNDKIGLIVFAGDAYTQIPITDDYPSVKMFLSTTGPDMISKQGTAIGAAIELAIRSFPTDESSLENGESLKNKAIVIITDGENHEDDAITAAKDAYDKGIKIFTIGLGDPAGVPIPLSPGSNAKRRNKDGSVVVSKLNERLLMDIAREADGAYIPVGRINSLMEELNKLQKTESKKKVYADYAERYQYFVGFGFLLLILEALIQLRKNPLIRKMNLFKV